MNSETWTAVADDIREHVIRTCNEAELSKADTVAILTYLIHDIMHTTEKKAE